MADISADKVRELREKSGAGMMDCKRALAETGGDLERSIEFLRKEGVLKAAKKVGRATLEGLIGVSQSADRRSFALIEVNCETDFVARTDQFQLFLGTLGEHLIQQKPKDLDALLGQRLGNNTVQEALSQLIARIGENMTIRRFRLVQAAAGDVLGGYLHAGSKIGTVVRIRGEGADEGTVRDIAMHIAAMAPHYIHRKEIPLAVLDREKEILRASPEVAGKPEHLLDRILEGKLNRYFSEVCLVDQPFVKDPGGKKTVGDFLHQKSPKGEIMEVARFQVGEEIS